MKKSIALILTLLVLLTTAVCAVSITPSDGWVIYNGGGYRYGPSVIINDDKSVDAWFSSPGSDETDLFDRNNSGTAYQLSGQNSVAQKFHSDKALDNISVVCATWSTTDSSIHFALYKWNTDYATTVAGTPISDKTYPNIADGSKVVLDQGSGSLPAGDYLWVATLGSGKIGIWQHSNTVSGNVDFINGKTKANGSSYGDFEAIVNYEYYGWDCIRYRHSTDGGKSWTEQIALTPTPNSADALSCCDPGVFKLGNYYYIGYTSIPDNDVNDVFLARSSSPTGPFEKWDGSGWSNNPKPWITYDGPDGCFGAGEPSFVVKDGVVYVYYTWASKDADGNPIDETRVATAPANGDDWPAHLTYQGVAVEKDPYLAMDACDVKYIDGLHKFIAACTAKRMTTDSYIQTYESTDGIHFTPSQMLQTGSLQPYLHNMGLSGTADGHIDLSQNNFLAYAYGNTWANWKTYLNPVTYTDDNVSGSNSSASVSSSVPASSPVPVSSSAPASSPVPASSSGGSSSVPAASSSMPATLPSAAPSSSSSAAMTESSGENPTAESAVPITPTAAVSSAAASLKTAPSEAGGNPYTGDDSFPTVFSVLAVTLAAAVLMKRKFS